MRRLQIAVIGSAGPEEYRFKKPLKAMYQAAEELGVLLAQQDAIVVNGGKGGVMEAVCRGAKAAGGITVAEISGAERNQANPYVDIEIVTCDQGFRGPSQLVGMSDGVIALGGGAGTLQEICVAYRMVKPLVLLTGFGGWADQLAGQKYLDERRLIKFEITNNPEKAVAKLTNLVQSKKGN